MNKIAKFVVGRWYLV